MSMRAVTSPHRLRVSTNMNHSSPSRCRYMTAILVHLRHRYGVAILNLENGNRLAGIVDVVSVGNDNVAEALRFKPRAPICLIVREDDGAHCGHEALGLSAGNRVDDTANR